MTAKLGKKALNIVWTFGLNETQVKGFWSFKRNVKTLITTISVRARNKEEAYKKALKEERKIK